MDEIDLDLSTEQLANWRLVISESTHFNKKGILSDYWHGYLDALEIQGITEVSFELKKKVMKDMLYRALEKEIFFDPFPDIISFYIQNKRDGKNEIKKYKKMFGLLINLKPLLENGFKRILEDKYYEIRKKIYENHPDNEWTLYGVINHPEFQEYVKMCFSRLNED